MIRALAITGPTASGKTALSLEVARRFGCEIISCDSMQVYKQMDIGTAKATEEERAAVPHRLIDFLSPSENYSAESYREDAIAAARAITAEGRIPLFVGGTGLYIDTVMRPSGVESQRSDSELQKKLVASVRCDEDKEALWERLREIDPQSAEKIHKNNVRRVARAIEIYEQTGKTKTYFDTLSREGAPEIQVSMITLDFHNRENLYSRVDSRVEEMLRLGLEDEVRGLYEAGLLCPEYTAAQAIGYKEMLAYIRGEATLSEAVEQIKLSTRRYAKRQLTWFRHEVGAYRLYLDTEDGVMRSSEELLAELIDAVGNIVKKKYIF